MNDSNVKLHKFMQGAAAVSICLTREGIFMRASLLTFVLLLPLGGANWDQIVPIYMFALATGMWCWPPGG